MPHERTLDGIDLVPYNPTLGDVVVDVGVEVRARHLISLPNVYDGVKTTGAKPGSSSSPGPLWLTRVHRVGPALEVGLLGQIRAADLGDATIGVSGGRSRGEAIFRARAFRQTAPLSRLCSMLHSRSCARCLRQFWLRTRRHPILERTAEHFEFPGR